MGGGFRVQTGFGAEEEDWSWVTEGAVSCVPNRVGALVRGSADLAVRFFNGVNRRL